MKKLFKKLLKPLVKELVQEENKLATLNQISSLNDQKLEQYLDEQISKIAKSLTQIYATT